VCSTAPSFLMWGKCSDRQLQLKPQFQQSCRTLAVMQHRTCQSTPACFPLLSHACLTDVPTCTHTYTAAEAHMQGSTSTCPVTHASKTPLITTAALPASQPAGAPAHLNKQRLRPHSTDTRTAVNYTTAYGLMEVCKGMPHPPQGVCPIPPPRAPESAG
jgi:hypothetical protein